MNIEILLPAPTFSQWGRTFLRGANPQIRLIGARGAQPGARAPSRDICILKGRETFPHICPV